MVSFNQRRTQICNNRFFTCSNPECCCNIPVKMIFFTLFFRGAGNNYFVALSERLFADCNLFRPSRVNLGTLAFSLLLPTWTGNGEPPVERLTVPPVWETPASVHISFKTLLVTLLLLLAEVDLTRFAKFSCFCTFEQWCGTPLATILKHLEQTGIASRKIHF